VLSCQADCLVGTLNPSSLKAFRVRSGSVSTSSNGSFCQNKGNSNVAKAGHVSGEKKEELI